MQNLRSLPSDGWRENARSPESSCPALGGPPGSLVSRERVTAPRRSGFTCAVWVHSSQLPQAAGHHLAELEP